MGRVGIVGAGTIRFEAERARPIEEMLREASLDALATTKNLEGADIGAVMVSTNDGSPYLGPIVAEAVGANAGAAQKVESLCSSGTSALVSAWAHVSAGLADAVLVVGADTYDGPGRVFEWDASRGSDRRPIAWASAFAGAYMKKHNVKAEEIATVAARAHQNAQANDDAYEHEAWTVEDVMESRLVAPGLHLLECSRACTGAAAVIVASEAVARRCNDDSVWITGVGQRTLGASITTNPSMSRLESAAAAAADTLRMAGVGARDIDVAEIHDAFAVCEPMAAEAVGLAPAGCGAAAICDMHSTGNRMINPRGGILGSGHALGATGIAQAAEIARQLGGQASKRQVASAEVGLVHNMAAAATSSTVLVMQR